jgi:hypothetical protein
VIANTQEFLSFNNPNYAKAAINFYVHQNHADEYVKVSTETRFYVPDYIALKKLARYWLLIHSFSAFSRRMWLRAIKHRIENVIKAIWTVQDKTICVVYFNSRTL